MLVHVVGAGAAGTALARALRSLPPADWTLGDVVSRSQERAEQRVALIGGGRPVGLPSWPDASPDEPALLLLCVPDRHIGSLAADLASSPWPAGSVALHVSGSEAVDVLAPLREQGLATGSLHPLKSFVGPADGDLTGVTCAVEGDPQALALAEALAQAFGAHAFRLAPGGRAAWHAGAAHACNHLVALVDQALDLMGRAGLDRDTARAALLPLLAGTVENLGQHPPGQALTGPVVRGDAGVVARHVAALEEPGLSSDILSAYRALAGRALHLARTQRDLDAELADRVEGALDPDAPGPG